MLDDRASPSDMRARAMADLVRSNSLFGGLACVRSAVRTLAPSLPRAVVLLDVGTGLGEIPRRLADDLGASGIRATALGVDSVESLARSALSRLDAALVADARHLPLRDRSADVVTCSQLLHHFFDDDLRAVIAELHRVSRGWVVIGDLRRSRIAPAVFAASSVALGFHPVTRRDGVVSLRRGFTSAELASLVRGATGVAPIVRRGVFFRLTATWRASG